MTLTSGDLKNIKVLFNQVIDENESLVKKDDISHLPTKEEFYGREDKLMGELKTTREEIVILSDLNRKVNDNEERIEKIEEKLNLQPPS
ncbi:MAG: hypothetical protein UU16_C0013G0004 [Candidatus Woesebacteria bacterium GW2011_GWA2_40_7]|uniref:Uncharacterized protein n=3 Tax=Candidatus Woeseibacteriota TaxID=1752722 RepID=A0A0G0P1E3_9BACT|nr:MAG: hypothetical protein UT17_C0004G0292 [Candidatus Woesebacteria bacterium GW2011_GWB1_39_10]KKR73790.1 MAG: hypothetical protein UU16_C0013G0004 [Candidatus Woesebacteria bacterium GW2011_GWA2_40_7]KKS90935.1 MAG: hypothetical protein UV66_C0001G0292 [Candidatus Woesebacteria bacterium GW2011_GWA1_43_12]